MTASDFSSEPRPGGGRPPLRVISGDASPEEIAAIVAVLTAASGSGNGSGTAPARSRWADPAARLRPAHSHGIGAWRFSARAR